MPPSPVFRPAPRQMVAAGAAAINATTNAQQDKLTDVDWASRLCWVHRIAVDEPDGDENKVTAASNKPYFWPAIYYHGWSEANSHYIQNLTGAEKMEWALNSYRRQTTTSLSTKSGNDKRQEDNIVVARLLGATELFEIDVEGNDFCNEFCGWVTHVMDTCCEPSHFANHIEWYLPFLNAIDEAFVIMRNTGGAGVTAAAKASLPSACQTMLRLGQKRLAAYQQESTTANTKDQAGPSLNKDKEQDADCPEPETISPTHETPTPSNKIPHGNGLQDGSGQDKSLATNNTDNQPGPSPNEDKGLDADCPDPATISPSSTHETPTRSNKSPRGQGQQDGGGNEKSLGLFSSSGKNKADMKSSTKIHNVTPHRTSNVAEDFAVTPSGSWVRPKRKAAQKTDALMLRPTSCGPQSARRSSDDEDFYKFKPLMAILQKELGWTYARPKTTALKNWVYERVDTDGELGGTYLEDFFYEEEEVVEYCRNNNYKKKFGYLLKEKTPKQGLISPSPNKRHRATAP